MSQGCLSNTSSNSSLQTNKRKIQLCRAYIDAGYCRYDEGCSFAHGIEQLMIGEPVLKSKICRNFNQNGHCRFGDRCNFKHQIKMKAGLTTSFKYYPEIISLGILCEVFLEHSRDCPY